MSFHRFDLLHIFVAGFVLTLIFSLVAWIYHLAAKGINKLFEGPSAETKKLAYSNENNQHSNENNEHSKAGLKPNSLMPADLMAKGG